MRSVSDAAVYAPNTFFNEFTARKLSNPRFRGIGSSPTNPGVTSYIDGVPQLNANSSSIELLDVDQIEFVRGPQSALYGRNALGGVINVISARPGLKAWTGGVAGPFGNFNNGELRATASGPLKTNTLAVGVGIGYSGHDGYTTNDVTGHDLDSRSAVFGKGQVLWLPAKRWEVRGMFSGERARDGDYALNDLGALRTNPFHASRNVEGYTNRNIVSPTLRVGRTGPKVDFSATTGFVWWKTEDLTDLDYTALPLFTRNNAEKAFQFTEEVRFASAKNAPIVLADHVTMRWQAGVFIFTQGYEQDAVNNFSPFVLSQFINFAVAQHSPQSTLDDRGLGVYGQGTWTFSNNLDVTAGLRGDRENKQANMNTFYSPAIAPPTAVIAEKAFGDVSPQFAVALAHDGHHSGDDSAADRLLHCCTRIQGRRVQPGLTGRLRGVRTGAQLELRGRREDLVAGGSSVAQRRGIPHRLERPAGQPAESPGAWRSSTSPTRVAPPATAWSWSFRRARWRASMSSPALETRTRTLRPAARLAA